MSTPAHASRPRSATYRSRAPSPAEGGPRTRPATSRPTGNAGSTHRAQPHQPLGPHSSGGAATTFTQTHSPQELRFIDLMLVPVHGGVGVGRASRSRDRRVGCRARQRAQYFHPQQKPALIKVQYNFRFFTLDGNRLLRHRLPLSHILTRSQSSYSI